MGSDRLRVVCAGDRFIPADILAEDLRSSLARHGLPEPDVVELSSRWPDEPFRSVDGVREAAGDPAELEQAVAGAHAVVTHLAPLTESVLRAAGDTLRVVGVTRGGPVNVDLDAAARSAVQVVHLPGRNLSAVAEFCVGTMVCAMRGIPAAAGELAQGRWDATAFRYDRTGTELSAAVVGLVGYGAVGRRVAELLGAFGSTVLAHDPYADPDPAGQVRFVDLAELLSASHVVSLHARLTDDTRHLVDAAAIAAMRPGAVLVNTARGELVDEAAVAEALASGHLRAAVLDVFDPEPPEPGSLLLGRPDVLATPHLAGASRQVAEGSSARIAEAVARVLAGEEGATTSRAPDDGSRRR